MNERQRKIENTKQYFLKNFVEDPFDGTGFDCDFLDAMNELIERYADRPAEHMSKLRSKDVTIPGNQAR